MFKSRVFRFSLHLQVSARVTAARAETRVANLERGVNSARAEKAVSQARGVNLVNLERAKSGKSGKSGKGRESSKSGKSGKSGESS